MHPTPALRSYPTAENTKYEQSVSQSVSYLCTSGPLVLQVVTLVADNHTEVEEVQLLPHSVDLYHIIYNIISYHMCMFTTI